MPTKIRLQRHGRKKRPFYYIVIADGRAPRDGRFIERLGSYNPITVPATIEVDVHKAIEWMNKGAEPTKTVRAILKYKGALYFKHLLRGVKKEAMSLEDAEAKFKEWQVDHESKITDSAKKVQDTVAKDKADKVAKIRAEREAAAAAIATAAAEEAAAADKAKADAKAAAEAEAAAKAEPVVEEEAAPEATSETAEEAPAAEAKEEGEASK
ncbi:MAG: small subunit ribosomal protein S16 [Limisphaerales bacterium]|jgi:small subunit ribosomal protein S16